VDGPRCRFAVDFGASSLIALAQQGTEHNSIDAVLLTHLHGAHAAIREVLFPGSHVMTPRFPVDWIEMEPGRPHPVLDLLVIPECARHTEETNPTARRIQVGDKAICYTGDTEWTDEVARAAQDTDLLIAESYFYDKPALTPAGWAPG